MDRVTVFAEEAFTLYEGLTADNSKTYWTAHKGVYETAVREPMRELLEKLALSTAKPPVPRLKRSPPKLAKAGFEVGGEHVRTRPRGVAPDHPRLDLMRREYLTVGRHLPPEQVTTTTVGKHWRSLKPLITWVLDNAPPS
jgi:uncharacterized protein (DUF2461 family)